MCVIVSMQDGSISSSRLVGMASSSQDLFFIDMISFWTSSILRGEIAFIVVCYWLAVWILQCYWVHVLLFVFFQWRNPQNPWLFLHVTFDLVVGLFVCYWWCCWLQRIAAWSPFHSPIFSWLLFVVCGIPLVSCIYFSVWCMPSSNRLSVFAPCPPSWSYCFLLAFDVFVEPWLFGLVWVFDCF